MGAADSSWADLRRLADWFSTSPQRQSLQIERVIQRLGTTAIALLGRELRQRDARRREASRNGLAQLAADVMCRARVVAELRAVTDEPEAADEIKVCALGLLSELGERAAARFMDPDAIQTRSAIALASQISSDADVASAADLMVRQLQHADMVQMLEVMIDAAPVAAHRLASELAVRLDLSTDARADIAGVLVGREPPVALGEPRAARRTASPRTPRGTTVAVLVDASARLVVVVSKKILGERRHRRWAVLINPKGVIDDCLHEDAGNTENDAAPLIASLVADGYRVASSELEHARTVVTAAARLTAATPSFASAAGEHPLSSAYYLGRDLLDLGDAHLGSRRDARSAAATATLARALEYIGDGEIERGAQLLVQSHALDSAEHWGAVGYVHLHHGALEAAAAAFERAIGLEPEWPLHHWNLAVALHQLHDASGCFHALRRFIVTSSAPTGLLADSAQPDRLVTAERMMTALERAARIAGTPLRRRRRKAASKRVPVTPS